jgi:hypothetical protein
VVEQLPGYGFDPQHHKNKKEEEEEQEGVKCYYFNLKDLGRGNIGPTFTLL